MLVGIYFGACEENAHAERRLMENGILNITPIQIHSHTHTDSSCAKLFNRSPSTSKDTQKLRDDKRSS